jgi:hypothetical protein
MTRLALNVPKRRGRFAGRSAVEVYARAGVNATAVSVIMRHASREEGV